MQTNRFKFRRLVQFGNVPRVLLSLVMAVTIGGCVQRRLTIRSNPPGARVYVGDEEVGTTPVSTDFVYYGTRKIRLVKSGYETLVVNQPIPTPWYQIPPLDFVSEILVPGEIRDERVINYQLLPLQAVPTDQLLSRAEQLREASGVRQASGVMPAVDSILVPTGPTPGAAAPPLILPEPAKPGPRIAPPAGQTPLFAPPGGGPAAAPPIGAQPVVPATPPPYNPPQYLPPG
ncbi:MAG: PEGA domain-containing protein [Pirellulales bacterium]